MLSSVTPAPPKLKPTAATSKLVPEGWFTGKSGVLPCPPAVVVL